MIHYVTTNGIGNAWVANELSRLDAAGVPFVLHALRKPEALFHGSDWAVRLNQRTRSIYPLPGPALVLSLLLAPLLFRGRFFAALLNALFGRREHLRARLGGIAHLAVACHWARRMLAAPEPVTHIHSQWIHSCGTVAMYLGWLLDRPFSFTGHATDLFRDRCALLDKIEREKIKGAINVTRFKGLGEMNPSQLRESTIHPDTRRLVQLTIDDADETRSLMDMLLSKKRASDRKTWLETKGDLATLEV